jgi:hypothetical protein
MFRRKKGRDNVSTDGAITHFICIRSVSLDSGYSNRIPHSLQVRIPSNKTGMLQSIPECEEFTHVLFAPLLLECS